MDVLSTCGLCPSPLLCSAQPLPLPASGWPRVASPCVPASACALCAPCLLDGCCCGLPDSQGEALSTTTLRQKKYRRQLHTCVFNSCSIDDLAAAAVAGMAGVQLLRCPSGGRTSCAPRAWPGGARSAGCRAAACPATSRARVPAEGEPCHHHLMAMVGTGRLGTLLPPPPPPPEGRQPAAVCCCRTDLAWENSSKEARPW
jgi:hypothetical protein